MLVEIVNYIDDVFFILVGCLGLMIAYRKWPENTDKKKEWDAWHESYGKTMKIVSPIIIIFGLISLSGILD